MNHPAMVPPGRLLMVDFEGTALDAGTADFLRTHGIRAVCLFRKNLGTEAQIRRLTADLCEVMGAGALIAMDQEGGSVVRATSLPQAPGAMALGAVDDEALCEHTGAAVARGLRHMGVNWNFAPVLDVNSNPANPVIAERSFGANPQRVAQLARAWLRGSLGEGVAGCLKHFPGHGDTHQDSHHDLPVVNKTEAELEATELLPFRALAADAPSVMTAHIVYPQLDPEHPATLSRAVLTGLLRQRLGYTGVVITDALMMQAVHRRWGHSRSALLALAAGADMPLAQGSRSDQLAALQAIDRAQRDGTLDPAALQAAVQRLDALAARFPATPRAMTDSQWGADQMLVRAGWARSLCALGGARPPRRDEPLRVVVQGAVASDGVSEAGLPAQALRPLFKGFADVQFIEVPSLLALDEATLRGDGRRRVVLASNQRSRYVSPQPLRPDLHLVLWNPYQVLDVAAPAVVTWGYADGALAALRAWLLGEAGAPGKSPVPLAPATRGTA
jgi:beta-N-acetylhexosaminidase